MAFLIGVACRAAVAAPLGLLIALAAYGAAMACARRLARPLRTTGLLVLWVCVGMLRGAVDAQPSRFLREIRFTLYEQGEVEWLPNAAFEDRAWKNDDDS